MYHIQSFILIMADKDKRLFSKFAAMPLKLTTYHHGSEIPILPENDTFHSTELFHIYEATRGYTPILVVAYENEKPVAKVLAVTHNTLPFRLPFFRKCVIYGEGEYFCKHIDREAIFNLMLNELTRIAIKKSFLIEFRNLDNALFGYKAFRENHYFAINWLRVRNSLHSVHKVEERLSPSRRRQIKKGLTNGAEVRETHSPEDIQAFAQMLHHIYSSKIRRHFPNKDFFLYMERQMQSSKRSRIFIVTHKNKIIGGSVCIYSGENAYLWFSGGMRKTYALQYPGILAVWHALIDAKQRGYRHLEFIDVGLPFRKHGYREFVLRFGGKQSSTRRWFRVRWEWLNKLMNRMYE